MARIDWPAVDSDRAVEAAALLELLSAFVAMRAQRLQFAESELRRIVVVRHDVIGNACGCDLAFPQTPLTERLRAQLSASASVPKRFVVKLAHPSSLFAS
jgi:hypothetical protein